MEISNKLIREIRETLAASGKKALCKRLDVEIEGNKRHLSDCFYEYLQKSRMHHHCMHDPCDEAGDHLSELLDEVMRASGLDLRDVKKGLDYETVMRCEPYNRVLSPEDADKFTWLIEHYAWQYNGGMYQPAVSTMGDIREFVYQGKFGK